MFLGKLTIRYRRFMDNYEAVDSRGGIHCVGSKEECKRWIQKNAEAVRSGFDWWIESSENGIAVIAGQHISGDEIRILVDEKGRQKLDPQWEEERLSRRSETWPDPPNGILQEAISLAKNREYTEPVRVEPIGYFCI